MLTKHVHSLIESCLSLNYPTSEILCVGVGRVCRTKTGLVRRSTVPSSTKGSETTTGAPLLAVSWWFSATPGQMMGSPSKL